MLDEIHIRNVALIEETSFEPSSGFTVITGETGAGKTALLNALKLLVGERNSASYLREGAKELQVEGRFFGLSGMEEFSDDELVVKRRITDKGRSKAYINGELATAKDLAEVIGTSVDLCGQHEHQHLLKPSYQRACLDAWGNLYDELSVYQHAFVQVQQAQKDLDEIIARNENNQLELDRARFIVEQITAVNPGEDEYETLLAQMPRYEHGEMLMQNTSAGINLLSADGAVLSQVDDLLSIVQTMEAADNSLSNMLQSAKDAYFALEDINSELHSYKDTIDFSPEELELRQARVNELQGLIRGYGPTMENVFSCLQEAQNLIDEHESLDDILAQKRANLASFESELRAAADALSKKREETAQKFAQSITEQMKLLNMGSAFVTFSFEDLSRDQWTKWGSQKFEIFFAPGEALKPANLTQIASGGEISRVMLAIKVCLGSVDQVDTLIFDEIDAGVGGQTARALALVLKSLSETHQVIVVTHLAQVAALGDVHYFVEKTDGKVPVTTLRKLEEPERVSEIARMLSGDASDLSIAHAKELLGMA